MATKEDRIAEVVRAVREFHALGGRSLAARPGRGAHGSKAIDTEAEQLGVSADYLRKAREFANPETGYDGTALDALCRAVEDSYDTFDARNTAFGVSHLLRLVTVRKGREREQVETSLFAHGWSTRELNDAIRAKYGRRKQGGRRKRVGGGKMKLLGQLDAFAASWQRWYAQIKPEDDAGKAPIDTLPDDVRDAVTRAARHIEALRKAVSAALPAKAASDKRP